MFSYVNTLTNFLYMRRKNFTLVWKKKCMEDSHNAINYLKIAPVHTHIKIEVWGRGTHNAYITFGNCRRYLLSFFMGEICEICPLIDHKDEPYHFQTTGILLTMAIKVQIKQKKKKCLQEFLLWHRGLRVSSCCSCGVGCICSSDSILGPETSIGHGYSQKTNKQTHAYIMKLCLKIKKYTGPSRR